MAALCQIQYNSLSYFCNEVPMPQNSETYLNRTSLEPTFAFGLDRCSVNRVLIDKDFLPWDFIYGSVNTGFRIIQGLV